MAYVLCTGCLEIFDDADRYPEPAPFGSNERPVSQVPGTCENCQPLKPSAISLTPIQAAELNDRKWIGASIERIADALEELCTFKEEEQRARNRDAGIKEH